MANTTRPVIAYPAEADTPITKRIKQISLLWPLILLAGSVFVMQVKLVVTQEAMHAQLNKLAEDLQHHVDQPGHREAIERWNMMQREVDELKRYNANGSKP